MKCWFKQSALFKVAPVDTTPATWITKIIWKSCPDWIGGADKECRYCNVIFSLSLSLSLCLWFDLSDGNCVDALHFLFSDHHCWWCLASANQSLLWHTCGVHLSMLCSLNLSIFTNRKRLPKLPIQKAIHHGFIPRIKVIQFWNLCFVDLIVKFYCGNFLQNRLWWMPAYKWTILVRLMRKNR